jgi:ent-kaurene oxidase
MAVTPWTFKDGLTIPAGSQIGFPNLQIARDPDLHPDADTFDAKRYLRKREEIDPTKFHFASVTDDSLHFGSGFHACPGRFLSQDAIKLIFIHLLSHYDLKYAEDGQKRPADMPLDFSIMPDAATSILLKERSPQ